MSAFVHAVPLGNGDTFSLAFQCVGPVSYTHLDEINHLEKNIKAMPSVTTMLEEGKTVRDMLELALEGFQPDILDSYHVTYRCDCSEERVENMIRSLGKKEVEKLRDEDPIAEVNCQFCNKNYKVDLNKLLKKWPASDEKQELEKP